MEMKRFRELVLLNPSILNKTATQHLGDFAFLEKNGIRREKLFDIFFEVPDINSFHIEKKIMDLHYIFELYN